MDFFAKTGVITSYSIHYTKLYDLPLGVAALRRLGSYARSDAQRLETLVPAQGWTLLSFVLMAIGLGVGMLLGGL